MPNLEKLEIVLERFVFTPEWKWVYQLRFKLDGREFAISRELPEAAAIDLNLIPTQRWISVKDRLPEDNSNVIACLWIGEESRVYPAFYAHGVWWDRVFSTPTTNTTTHWQPMPQPPKGE